MPRFTTSANCTGTLSAAQKTPETARPRSETQPEWGKRGRPPPAMRGPEAATPRVTRYSATASPGRQAGVDVILVDVDASALGDGGLDDRPDGLLLQIGQHVEDHLPTT